MYINPDWRILTIGDGDLSFSASLLKHHRPRALTATIFDPLSVLTDKYGDVFYQQLRQQNITVLTGFDVTNTQSWNKLEKQQFDLVIFQFPLIPGFTSKTEFEHSCHNQSYKVTVNTLNRHLLRQFITHSFAHFLDPKGEGLCYITSKDVKPYREWDIETALLYGLENSHTQTHYLGQMPFDIQLFPNYRIRNVDRDKHVKDTQGNVYVWSQKTASNVQAQLINKLTIPAYADPSQAEKYCRYCRVGPFFSATDKQDHANSKRHKKMFEFDLQWQNYLS